MPQDSILNKAKFELDLLVKADDEGNRVDDPIPFSSIERIRELFDDIENLRKRKYKLSVILHSINNSGMNLSMSHFKTILSRIRKEKGINRTNNRNGNIDKSLKKDKQNINKLVDTEKPIDVRVSPLQRNDIDKSHYTSDDWANEWELIMDIYKSNHKNLKYQYQAMGGDINDVIHLTNSLKDIRIISDKTSTLFRKYYNEYKIRSQKR
ncbi:hypothetical protein [Photobacterium iliopiscarium]|uniref:hypothetical protein n=1 Tax=Photobacterium iliopiscarium TaxID=56192 RepID=UPI001F482053|nr:hypothetical protein [Photobacterium iliopiscarium]MCF2245864.1 hypothetical protein [Photobacterium iliopiscarium]